KKTFMSQQIMRTLQDVSQLFIFGLLGDEVRPGKDIRGGRIVMVGISGPVVYPIPLAPVLRGEGRTPHHGLLFRCFSTASFSSFTSCSTRPVACFCWSTASDSSFISRSTRCCSSNFWSAAIFLPNSSTSLSICRCRSCFRFALFQESSNCVRAST